ncbi:MAG: hypothetical protein ACO3A4_07265 [Silvanigrellaceae bacterium]
MLNVKTHLLNPRLLILLGVAFMFVQLNIGRNQPVQPRTAGPFQKFPIQAVVANGHLEFAWLVVAIQGLAETVNTWTTLDAKHIDIHTRTVQLAKFEDTLSVLPDLANQTLGMRELFLFPASVMAFELSDINRAIEIARLGAKDIRLEADLALSIAYLTHIFKGDLKQAASDYERVQLHYPNVSWLKETIALLKMGVDPFQRPGRSRGKICFMMTKAFPLSKNRLIERGICNKGQEQDGTRP